MFFSQVKYKADLTWLKGIGCYAYDTPDFTLAEKNKTLYSKVCIYSGILATSMQCAPLPPESTRTEETASHISISVLASRP